MTDFWQVHGETYGLWLLIGLFLFPRITMLVAVLTPFSFLYWLGWLIAPRFLAAYIASCMYWNTNKPLVVLAWVAAILASSGETKAAASN